MATEGFNEVYDQNGNVIASTPVTIPELLVDDAQMAQAKQTTRTMMDRYFPDGVPTGTVTANDVRNWLIALTTGLRYQFRITDTDLDG